MKENLQDQVENLLKENIMLKEERRKYLKMDTVIENLKQKSIETIGNLEEQIEKKGEQL